MRVVYSGRGCEITENDGIYQISWEEGIFGKTVQYEISQENAERAMRSDDDAYAVAIFAETGSWPSSEEEKLEDARNLIRKLPELLLKNPDNRKLFSPEELEELLKKSSRGE